MSCGKSKNCSKCKCEKVMNIEENAELFLSDMLNANYALSTGPDKNCLGVLCKTKEETEQVIASTTAQVVVLNYPSTDDPFFVIARLQ